MRRRYPGLASLVTQFMGLQSSVYANFIPMTASLVERDSTIPEPTTTPALSLQQNSACFLVGEALAICLSLTPGFNTLLPTAQAQCLCYSSTAWAPNIFDQLVESCANFASAAVPSAYAPLSNLEGFCTLVGDVEGLASNTAGTVTTMLNDVGGSSGSGTSGQSETIESISTEGGNVPTSFGGYTYSSAVGSTTQMPTTLMPSYGGSTGTSEEHGSSESGNGGGNITPSAAASFTLEGSSSWTPGNDGTTASTTAAKPTSGTSSPQSSTKIAGSSISGTSATTTTTGSFTLTVIGAGSGATTTVGRSGASVEVGETSAKDVIGIACAISVLLIFL